MKHSQTTFYVLLAISLGILDVVTDVIETGYLMGKKPEFRWNYQRFQGFEKSEILKKLDSLNRQGLINKIEDKYFLSKRGKAKFLELDFHFSSNLPKNIPWKGIWYLISFDIPQNCKSDREKLRRILTQSGFIKIQQSLYVYPHNISSDCEKIQYLFPKRHILVIKTSSKDITNLVYSEFKKRKIII